MMNILEHAFLPSKHQLPDQVQVPADNDGAIGDFNQVEDPAGDDSEVGDFNQKLYC